MPARRILVTGVSGALGDATVRSLRASGHRVRGFDCKAAFDDEDHCVGDLQDVDALYAAAEGAEVIVHFGAVPDRDDFVERLVPVNIVGTYNLFEVARMRATPRVVFASSCRVLGALDWATETLTL